MPSLFTVVTERPMTFLLATLATVYLFYIIFHQKRISLPWTFFNKLFSLTILIRYPPGLFMREKKEEKIVFFFFLKIVLYIFSNSHQSEEVHNKMKFFAFSQRYSSVLWLECRILKCIPEASIVSSWLWAIARQFNYNQGWNENSFFLFRENAKFRFRGNHPNILIFANFT